MLKYKYLVVVFNLFCFTVAWAETPGEVIQSGRRAVGLRDDGAHLSLSYSQSSHAQVHAGDASL